jgi:ubiquitin C-terminal hydrolase
MSKQVNYSHIAVYKTEFDLLYGESIHSTDPSELYNAVQRMIHLQDKIISGLDRAPQNIPRYSSDLVIDVEKVKREVQEKFSSMLNHSSNPDFHPLAGRVDPLETSTLSLPNENRVAHLKATDFAVGFGNLSNNCWINSLLSMILTLPTFRHAYETVANDAAQDNINELNRIHGQLLLNGLEAYDDAFASKRPVASAVSQDVRLAFNHFFGYKNPHTQHEIFSKQAYNQEDASEGMQVLMGRYEQIVRERAPLDPLPPPYSTLQTRRHYRPLGQSRVADREKLLRDSYSRLTRDNVSSVTNNDYQIILDLQNKGHLAFPALLSEYFRNTHLQGHDTGTYLLEDERVQQFELIGEGRQFTQVPQELMLTVKRFGSNLDGSGYKIAVPLAIRQILILPSEATIENLPIAYQLDAFNVHSGGFGGGHYIAYKKINGQWIEANDGFVRLVSEQEIDQVLYGQKGTTYTSYMHHYTLIPPLLQQAAIATSGALKTLPELISEIDKFSQEKTTCQQAIMQLETLSALLKTDGNPYDALQDLERIAPQILATFRHLLWLNDKTPDTYDYGGNTLNAYPRKLQEIRLPWLISPQGANLIEQMLIVQRNKLGIATEKLHEAHLRSFLEKMKSPSVSMEELLKELPGDVLGSLHGLIYHSHAKKFGIDYVNDEKFDAKYGKIVLENGDPGKTLFEATESVLNIWGKNIIEQLISEHQIKAGKLQSHYEKEQLLAFHNLLLYPSHEISNYQLFKAFERLDIRYELKEKLYWSIWYSHHQPQISNYGSSTFESNPRSLLTIQEPNLARPPVCATGANILYQMIKLLEKEAG